MNYPTMQGTLIEKALMDALEKYPNKSKHEIISIVTDQGFPRPSVRRIKGELLTRLIQYARILK